MGQELPLTDGYVPASDEQAEIDLANEIALLLSARDPDTSYRVMMRAMYVLRQRRIDAGLVIIDPELNVDVAFSVGRDESGC